MSEPPPQPNTIRASLELTLVDYLAVIGFDSTKGLEPDLAAESADFASNATQQKAPLDRSYQATILQLFPPKGRANYPFPVEVTQLCMPKGLRFYTEKKVPNQTQFHSFVLVREDGSRVHGCAFTFYEPVLEQEVRQQMFKLNRQYIEAKLDSDVPQHLSGSSGNHTLPRNVPSTSRRNFPNRESYYDSTSKPIYAAKCLCVVQRLPTLFSTQNLLCSLWLAAFRPKSTSFSLEQLVYWSLHQVPLPIPDTGFQCSFGGCELAVSRPGLGELPFFDYPIADLFGLIDVDQFIRLFASFLLEHQILLCSKYMDRLMLVAECLSALVFPFRWQLTYVPILPYSQLKFIEAPVPYLMGLCYEDRLPDQVFQSNICILDIDERKLDYPEEVPAFPRHDQISKQLRKLYKNNPDDFANELEQMSKNEANHNEGDVKVVMRRDHGAQRRTNANRMGVVEQVKLRTHPTKIPLEQWSSKRLSRSFDNSDSLEIALQKPPEPEMDNDEEKSNQTSAGAELPTPTENVQKYFNGLRFNAVVRNLFLHHFIGLFANYEQFVIIDKLKQDNEVRDSVVNFDKASFLSDQPDSFLPFLAAFLETQMFTSFVDSKLLAQWKEADEHVLFFDHKINEVKSTMAGAVQSRVSLVHQIPEFNFSNVPQPKPMYVYDVSAPSDHLADLKRSIDNVTFPEMDSSLFDKVENADSIPPWIAPNDTASLLATKLDEARRLQNIASPRKKQRRKKENSEGPIDKQQNYTFVRQLLKETKVKTNRLLLMKMGKEALDLGHQDSAVQGVEENTLVAGLCDLLDRVWANDLKKRTISMNGQNWPGNDEKKRKSALWTNVWYYCEKNKLDDQRHRSRHHPNVSPAPIPSQGRGREPVDESSTFTDIINQIRNFSTDLEDPNVSAWAKSLLKVANMLGDRVASTTTLAEEVRDAEGNFLPERGRSTGRGPAQASGTLDRLLGLRSNSVQPAPPAAAAALPPAMPHKANVYKHREPRPPPRSVHKSSSASDFAPQFEDGQRPLYPSSAREYYSSNPGTPSRQPRQRSNSRQPNRERKRSLSRSRDGDDHVQDFPPLPDNLLYDFHNVFRMTEIKTDIGYARAFVRLALERKLLHSHLKTILSDPRILRDLYRRSAFLRSEDEREQFLYHILSLTAVDFTCFTHTFRTTRMQYEVLLAGTLDRFASACVWIMCAGTLGSTQAIPLPPNSLQFSFDHKNLGVLTTLRIGHKEKTSKWLLHHVLVRNNITGQVYRFNCNRWFGRSVEDGALERVLVAEVVQRRLANDENSPSEPSPPQHQQYLNSVKSLMSTSMMNKLNSGSLSTLVSGSMSRPESPVSGARSEVGAGTRRRSTSRSEVGYAQHHGRNASLSRQPQYNYYSARDKHQRSPSVGQVDGQTRTWDARTNELQHRIGEAVNALVKHFYNQNQFANAEANLTQLLCGEKGLVRYLEQVFVLGRQDSLFSNRFFGKQYPWDYIEKAFTWFANLIPTPTGKALNRDQKSIIIYAYDMVAKISANANVGKEGKFQAFLLLTLRDHQLAALLPLLAWTPVTKQIYDETSILRQPSQLKALSRLLSSLDEFNINLEASLIYGIGV